MGAASADKDTAAAALADVTMTKATGNEIKLSAGENKIAFLLEKATYAPKTGSEVTLGSTTSNDVQANFELTAVAAAGKGVTAFTFGGAVNKNADWHTLSQGIEISATYSFETASGDETAVTGTGAMIEITSDAAFAEGTAVGTISYTVGEGSKALASITSITMDKNGTDFDGYHDLVKNWYAAKDEDGLITFDTLFVSAYASAYPDDTTREATVTYVTVGGETKTATVDVKLR